MVEDPRATPGADSIRPLNPPVPLEVAENERQRPAAVRLQGRWWRVVAIDDLWNVDEEWWRDQPVVRMYYEVRIEAGRRLAIFRDLAGGGWYQQRG